MLNHNQLTLTEIDKTILESYKTLVVGLANYLGDGYELVLHSLEDVDRSVIKIVNSYTGRKEGAPITNLALSMLEKIENEQHGDYISYFSEKNGMHMKSTTIAIRGERNRVIGLLCINFNMDMPLSKIINCFSGSITPSFNSANEAFVENVDELISNAVENAIQAVNADNKILPSLKNKEIVAILHGQGIFKVKDAVIKVADALGISKNTVYMHIRALNGATAGK